MDKRHVKDEIAEALDLLREELGAGSSQGDDAQIQMAILLRISNSLETIVDELRRASQ